MAILVRTPTVSPAANTKRAWRARPHNALYGAVRGARRRRCPTEASQRPHTPRRRNARRNPPSPPPHHHPTAHDHHRLATTTPPPHTHTHTPTQPPSTHPPTHATTRAARHTTHRNHNHLAMYTARNRASARAHAATTHEHRNAQYLLPAMLNRPRRRRRQHGRHLILPPINNL